MLIGRAVNLSFPEHIKGIGDYFVNGLLDCAIKSIDLNEVKEKLKVEDRYRAIFENKINEN